MSRPTDPHIGYTRDPQSSIPQTNPDPKSGGGGWPQPTPQPKSKSSSGGSKSPPSSSTGTSRAPSRSQYESDQNYGSEYHPAPRPSHYQSPPTYGYPTSSSNQYSSRRDSMQIPTYSQTSSEAAGYRTSRSSHGEAANEQSPRQRYTAQGTQYTASEGWSDPLWSEDYKKYYVWRYDSQGNTESKWLES